MNTKNPERLTDVVWRNLEKLLDEERAQIKADRAKLKADAAAAVPAGEGDADDRR